MNILFLPARTVRTTVSTVLLYILQLFSTADLGAQVSGTVYYDFNTTGVRENLATYDEPGYAGMTVTGYGADGTVYGPVLTTADGTYTLPGVNQPTRVEFTWTETWLFPSVAGGTSVQFVAGATTDVDLGVLYPGQYATPDTADVDMLVSCFVNGDPLVTTGTAPLARDGSAIASQAYGVRGGPSNPNDANSIQPPPNPVATAGEIGSVFGMAWSSQDSVLYSAAFIKRHCGLGSLGIGGIYVTKFSGATPTSTPFIDLVAWGVNVGTIADNQTRGLAGSVTAPSNDPDAYVATAALGLGDMGISDDGRTLYVVNLLEKNIVAITLDADNNPTTAPTAADVTSFPVPAVSCTDGNYRPFGLKFFRNKLYLGGVCDGDDGTPSNDVEDPANQNMFGYVHEFDPANPAAAGVEVLDFQLFTDQFPPDDDDYPHTGLMGGGCGFVTRNWHPWRDVYPPQFAPCGDDYQWPTPFIADIEFDYDGSMIIGIGDRMGLQIGNDNYGLTGTTAASVSAGGDILRAYPTGPSAWELEANGDKDGPGPFVPPAVHTAANEGPGGGEFYFGDNTPGFHNENALGGMGYYPGTGEILVATVDPPLTIFSNGVNYLSNETGDFNYDGTQGGYPLFYLPGGNGRANQAKAAGLGDIELSQDVPPLQIGNYLWLDTDMDGIQDPDELALANVTVELWADTDGDGVANTKVAETTTDANGNYLFSDAGPNAYGTEDWSFTAANEVQPFTNYEIRIPTTVTTDGATATLTTQNGDAATDNSPRSDIRDSDASPAGVIALTTGSNGAINHGFDAGFAPALPILSLGSTVFVDANNDGQQQVGTEAGIPGVLVIAYLDGGDGLTDGADDTALVTGADGIVGTADDADGPDGIPGTADDGQPGVLTDADGNYFFGGLATGNYYVTIPSGTFATDQPLETLPYSSNGTSSGFTETAPDDNRDGDDEGRQTAPSGATTSALINLATGEEPTDATTETAPGNGQDNDDATTDANGNMTLDFGFFAPVSLGDTAFVDLDANGLQDATDAPLAGVTVTIYRTGADTIVTTDAAGNPLPGTVPGTTVTDANGAYSFDNLPPGDYYVIFDFGTSPNPDFYTLTTPNVGPDDAVDSDGVMLTATTAQSEPTGVLTSGQRDPTLDVGVVCNPAVIVPEPFAVCATATLDLTTDFNISPAVAGFGGMFTVVDNGSDGVFLDAAGDELTAPFIFGTAVAYRIGGADAARGSLTLRLTTDDPPGACPSVSNEVTITVRQVDCGEFPWGGE